MHSRRNRLLKTYTCIFILFIFNVQKMTKFTANATLKLWRKYVWFWISYYGISTFHSRGQILEFITSEILHLKFFLFFYNLMSLWYLLWLLLHVLLMTFYSKMIFLNLFLVTTWHLLDWLLVFWLCFPPVTNE